jgi:hypothetical protein
MPAATVERPNIDAIIAKTSEWPYRFQVLSLSEMWIARYQRPVENIVESIVENFEPALVGTLIVSERRGKGKRYSVIDGQQRREAMKQLGLKEAPCLVFYELTEEEEATLFSKFQRLRKAITSFQRFNADLIAGNSTAIAIKSMVESEGFFIGDTTTQTHWESIQAVRVLETVYKEDPERLRTMLRLIRSVWKGMPLATRQDILRGLHYFVRDTRDLDEDRFIDRVKNVTPSDVSKRAVALREGKGVHTTTPKFVTEVLRDVYRSTPKQAARSRA